MRHYRMNGGGLAERAHYFARMRNLARQEAEAFVAQREEAGYPLLKGNFTRQICSSTGNLQFLKNIKTFT